MAPLSEIRLTRQIRTITSCFLVILTILFIVSFSTYSIIRQHLMHRQLVESLVSRIKTEINPLTQEVYFNQRKAIELRLSNLLELWRSDFLGAQGCIVLTTRTGEILSEACVGPKRHPPVSASDDPTNSLGVSMGQEKLADLKYTVHFNGSLLTFFPPAILMILMSVLVVTVLIQRLLA